LISRQKSRTTYKQRWGSEDVVSRDLDALDLQILKCINKKPGINVVSIWHCVYNGDSIKELAVRYRVKTLESAGLLTTKRISNERRCYPFEQ